MSECAEESSDFIEDDEVNEKKLIDRVRDRLYMEFLWRLLNVRVVLEKLPESVVKQYLANKVDTDDAENANVKYENYKSFCPRCQATSSDVAEIDCEQCGTPLVFECQACRKQYKKQSRYLYHLENNCEPEYRFQCAYCPFAAYFKNTIFKHLKDKHRSESKANPLKCKVCRKAFATRSALKSHGLACKGIKSEGNELEGESSKTDLPMPRSVPISNYNVVENLENADLSDSTNTTRRYCINCDESSDYDAVSVRSKQIACYKCGEKTIWQCAKCPKTFDKYETGKKHTYRVCFCKRLYQCSSCCYTTSYMQSMRNHLKAHDKQTFDGKVMANIKGVVQGMEK